ncbi:hypothetical protein V6N12_057954 [Hibiscus sabdariffa]|uniref:Uncharacterized protein n=1 Tax=Hibiscus sabdariffa TaxID=183260 RepID=A0ABR2AF19_9ROSI
MAGTELPITARAYNLGLESNLPHSRTRFQPSRIRKEIDVFIWLGAAAQEGKSAAALAACRTLSEELTEMRFLAPRILAK